MQSDVIVLGNAEQAKSHAEGKGGAPFMQRWAQAGASDQLRWSPGAAAPRVPHQQGCRRGVAMAPVKVEEENIISNNNSSSDKRDETG